MKRPVCNRVQIHASDEERAVVQASALAGEHLWKDVGTLKLAHEADASAEGVEPDFMAWYEEIGVEAMRSGATIAQYCSVYERAGAYTERYPQFGFAHFRALLALASKNGGNVDKTFEEWAATADQYGGKPVPVSVLEAALRGTGKPVDDPADKWAAALRSMQSACERAVRAVNDGAHPPAACLGLLDAVTESVTALCGANNGKGGK